MRRPRRRAEEARAAVSPGEERGGLSSARSPQPALPGRVSSAGSPQRAPLGQVSPARSLQPAPLSTVSSEGSPQWARAASGDRAEGRRRRRESLARGSRSWTRLRRPRRPEARRERARGRPSPLAAACGQRRGGDSEAGPVTGAGPGEAGDAPRPRLRLLPGPTAPSALGPPPPPPQATRPTAPFPAPQRLPGPARRAPGYLGQAGAGPGLWEPEECMAGGRRRRRGPPGSRSRAAWRLAPQGPAAACAPAGGEGWREEAAAPRSAL